MKTILILDEDYEEAPVDCWECEFGSVEWDCARCSMAFDEMNIGRESKTPDQRPSWCPIDALPKKTAVEDRWHSEEFARGWNACIEEIKK